ncbi:unnamed protein product [Amoebophrya sp. A120]|nr:unnamed protein product [Amoebophrya sp. A120]|eukprot:GSA120T00009706001.1
MPSSSSSPVLGSPVIVTAVHHRDNQYYKEHLAAGGATHENLEADEENQLLLVYPDERHQNTANTTQQLHHQDQPQYVYYTYEQGQQPVAQHQVNVVVENEEVEQPEKHCLCTCWWGSVLFWILIAILAIGLVLFLCYVICAAIAVFCFEATWISWFGVPIRAAADIIHNKDGPGGATGGGAMN